MKTFKLQLFFLLGLFGLAFVGSSCSSDDEDDTALYENSPFVGRWMITRIEDEEGKTDASYNKLVPGQFFNFKSDGTFFYNPFTTTTYHNDSVYIEYYETSESFFDAYFTCDLQKLTISFPNSYESAHIYTYIFLDNYNTLRIKLIDKWWSGCGPLHGSKLIGKTIILRRVHVNTRSVQIPFL